MKDIKLTKENKTHYAYARISTDRQLLDRQLDMLSRHDIPTSHYFTDVMSGTKGKLERPGLKALMEALAPGDILYIESFSRLSRSTKDLLSIVEELSQKEVIIHSEHESFDTATPTGQLMLTMVAALCQFERDVLAERTREGLASARARGHMGGRPRMDHKRLEMAFSLYDAGKLSVKDICEQLNIAQPTFYKYNKLRRKEEQKKRG